VYLREGKIFMMEQSPEPHPAGVPEQGKKTLPTRVEHFWLCGPCSAEMTVVYDRTAGVRVMPKPFKNERAAS
jgi:hypothetical protein